MTNKTEMVSVSRELLERIKRTCMFTMSEVDFNELRVAIGRSTRAAPAEDVRAVVDEPVAYVHEAALQALNAVGWVHVFSEPGEGAAPVALYRHPQHLAAPAIDFNEEILLPRPYDVRPGFCGEVKISFDAAEYRGRVWVTELEADEMIAIEGPENARKAGEALIAWAEAWEGKK